MSLRHNLFMFDLSCFVEFLRCLFIRNFIHSDNVCRVPNDGGHQRHVRASPSPTQRAFSILNNTIGDQQARAREDYNKAIMQLQFNSRGREYVACQKKKWKGGVREGMFV